MFNWFLYLNKNESFSRLGSTWSDGFSPTIIIPSITRCASLHTVLFTRLPPEIITRVLRYLPLSDRKNVRLTCKLLNQCSKHVSITKMEKFCFPEAGRRLCEILCETNSAVLNLVFRSSVDNVPVDVWRTCGDRIRDLYFSDFLENRVLLDILLHCDGLQSIGFGRYCSKPGSDLQLLSVLNRLIESNITRTEVRSLVFRRLGNDDLLRAFFSVFPNLEHLSAGFEDLRLTTESLKPFKRLRSLTYKVYSPFSLRTYWSEHQIAPELPKRLTKPRTDPSNSNLSPVVSESFLLRFLAIQNDLEVLRLLIPCCCEDRWGKEVMFHVLRSCPKLREFRFSAVNMQLETSDEVTEFVALTSNLRCLILGRLPLIRHGLSLPPTKFRLRMLAVHSDICNDELLLHILKHSPEMLHLYIGDDVRKEEHFASLVDLPELSTLVLEEPLVGLQSEDWYVGGLQNLKFLAIWLYYNHSRHVYLGRLRRFRDDHIPLVGREYDRILIDELREILSNMPVLKTALLPMLRLCGNRRNAIELFQNSKNLRHLICDFAELRYLRRLFRRRPNLKYVTGFRDLRTSSFDSSAKRIIIAESFLDLKEFHWSIPSINFR